MLRICDLPFELLIGVLRELDATSRKEFRLTCRQWAEAGAVGLSHRVYYAPRPDRIDIFNSIPENTLFAARFTELVYDARLHCRDVWVGGGQGGFRSQRSRKHDDSQTSIFETGLDWDTLYMGMKRLPNLQKISILDSFEDVVDISPFISTQHQWYRSWCTSYFTDTWAPLQWGEICVGHLCDFRGVENLFKFASLYAPKLQSLLLKHDGLSATIYDRPDAKAAMCEILPRLRKFGMDSDPYYGEDGRQKFGELFAGLLSEARQLNELSLCLDRSTTLKGKWPQLKVLEFSNGHLDFSTLKAFAQFHVDVLREVSLHDIKLAGNYSWEEVAEEIGQYWKLDLLSLSCMNDGNNSGTDIRGLTRLERIARSFMLRIPYDDLNMVGTEVAIITWHKQNYVPSPGFDSVVSSLSKYAAV